MATESRLIASSEAKVIDAQAMLALPRPPVFLPRAEVERRVGLGRSAIYKRMKEGTFPQAIHDIDSATVWWLESEIEAWQQQRIAQRGMGMSMGKKAKAPDFY